MSWNPALFLEFTLAVFLVLLNFSAAIMLFKAAKLNQQSKRDLDETLQLRKTIIEERDSSWLTKTYIDGSSTAETYHVDSGVSS